MEAILDDALSVAECAEEGLAIDVTRSNIVQRKSTGSFYTPVDVVEHFWQEYFRFHDIDTLKAVRDHLSEFIFVEPAVGAGIFLFGLMRKLVSFGCNVADLETLHFVGADVNSAALKFISGALKGVEAQSGARFSQIVFLHTDFLMLPLPAGGKISFIGNPPYVRNPAGAFWKNLYADFIARMLDVPAEQRSIALIVPLSVAFSRDYKLLRSRMRACSRAIRLESFDNIPDCLFDVGKPGSHNTNKANSQRCSIIMLRDFGEVRHDATDLRRWSRKRRREFLEATPSFFDISGYSFDEQFPRLSCDWISNYLVASGERLCLGGLLNAGRYGFSVGGVGRNYIGLRMGEVRGATPLTFKSKQHMLWALQLLGSPVFYEYWRTVGDGFHVTKSDILRFPISFGLLKVCIEQEERANNIWRRRSSFEREKQNAGRAIRSYDFRGQFDYVADGLRENPGVSKTDTLVGLSNAVWVKKARQLDLGFSP